eukprot:TRINITY_DN1983_c0_g1_i2.p1 TRINITY_DN1983_c0_g1~~TRINITY_DN1983_c0_g1_i2.p1  ORF type:complete len:348 (-),score=84.03 TRINITY_DN1983_c0_g1_i2:115-1158(-)
MSTEAPSDASGPFKLFIGQLPFTFTEQHLMTLCQPFGTVVDVHVMRDRMSGKSNGCGFVSFSSKAEADSAIAALNLAKTLPDMKAPLQVSYAEKKSTSSSVRQPAKLFVGHAPREVTEQQLRTLFEPYGKIVEIFVMKDHDGAGKGSAFVKYEDIADARSAIAGLHEKYQMEGATDNLVVRFAEVKNPLPQSFPMANFSNFANFNQMNPMSGIAPMGQPNQMPNAMSMLGQMYPQLQLSQIQQMNPSMNPTTAAKGPVGCNLFILNIPYEYGDRELGLLFSPFGEVVSSKIFMDKATGKSKGFGFVSFNNTVSARTAVASMNGFEVNGRKLKVQLKEEGQNTAGRPY